MTIDAARSAEPFTSTFGKAGMFSRVTFSTREEQGCHCHLYLKHLETSVASLDPNIVMLIGNDFLSYNKATGAQFWNYANALERWAEYAESRDFLPSLAQRFWEILIPQIFTGRPATIKSANALPVASNFMVDLKTIMETEVTCSSDLLTFALAHQYFKCMGGQDVSHNSDEQSADVLLNARFGCKSKVIFTGKKSFSIQRDKGRP